MKLRRSLTGIGLILGALIPLIDASGNIMLLLMKPFPLLGDLLRAWSLSGVPGNLAAWAVVLILSLLPTLSILILRRKRRQGSDILWPLTSLSAFLTLFFLINPTLLPVPGGESMAELSCMALVLTTFSLLGAGLLTRWAGGLTESKLTFWMNALIACAQGLTALPISWTLMESMLLFGESIPSDPFMEMMGASSPAPTMAVFSLILTLIALLPDLFTLRTLEAAAALTATLKKGWFSADTEKCAARLALCARQTLISAVCCSAGKNAASVLLAGFISGASVGMSVSMSLPLYEMAFSCGALLLARWLAAACKVKRDNDLMI